MPSTKYLCFSCRTTKRSMSRRDWSEVSFPNPSLICQHCSDIMIPCSSSIAIPRKTDDKAWKALMQQVSKWRIKSEQDARWRNHNRCVRLRDEAKNS